MSLERLGREFEIVAGGRVVSPRPLAESSTRLPADASLNHLSQEFLYEDLVAATDGFSLSTRLGMGTYGSVYQGTLRDGTEVAIKTLARPNESGFREEVEVLSRFRHPNLVILMGFARHVEERYLVYELLPGGDVCARLQKDATFTWRLRLSVIVDAALGLSHLHGSRPQVFHRDIKTQNILMDRNGTGKMADFGLACLAKPDCRSLTVENTSGTIGYADPLYIRTGRVTEASEVYSFGTVLLEILTGKPPALQHPDGHIEYQFSHIRGELSRVRAMLDPRGQWPAGVASLVGSLALRCVHQQEGVRPAFTEIVGDLRRWLREHSSDGLPPTSLGLPATQPSPSPASGYPASGSPRGMGVVGWRPAAAGVGAWSSLPSRDAVAAALGSQLDASSRVVGAGGVPLLPSQSLGASSPSVGPPPLPSRGYLSDPLSITERLAAERRLDTGGTGAGPPLRGWAGSSASSAVGSLQPSSLAAPGRELPTRGGPDFDPVAVGGPRQVPLQLAGWGTSQSSSSRRPHQADPLVARAERPFDRGPPTGVVMDCGPGLGESVGRGSPIVDTSPRACVDCGPPLPSNVAPLPDAGIHEHTRSTWLLGSRPLGAVETIGTDVWIDPLPPSSAVGAASSSSARGGILQSSFLHREAPLGAAIAEEQQAPASVSQVSDEQRAAMLRLQMEMGFSEMQVMEAFKRCSTVEGAVDWMLSPEREWNR